MTLQAAIDAELPYLRHEAEGRMRATATVYRKAVDANGSPVTTTDPATHRDVQVWEVLGTLPFRLDTGGDANGGSSGVTVGGITYEEASGVGHLPHDTDARLSKPLGDSDLLDVVGETSRVWRVVASVAYDQKTARRLPIVEESRPEEWA